MKRVNLSPLAKWEPPAVFSKHTRERLFLPIGLMPEKIGEGGARILMLNFDELERLGIAVPPKRKLTPSFEKALLERWAVRPAAEGETAQRTGTATRYQGYPGAVQGDGRAVLLEQGLRRDPKGRVRERIDVQVKGVATGLLPRRSDWASRHGKMFLTRAIQEALYADYLDRNQVASNRWLAIIDLGTNIIRPSDQAEIRVGLHVRSGQFWRMGHLWLLADDRRALADVLAEVRAQLAASRGRKTPLSFVRAYRALLQRKVHELADAWWLRYAHGSFTPDNIGLFECMDQGTACTVDRTHASFSAHRMGYGHAPDVLMDEDYKRHLVDILKKGATRAERRALTGLRPAELTHGWMKARMTTQLLYHFGLDEGQVRTVLRRHRSKAHGWWRTFRSFANEADRNREMAVGKRLTFRARHAAHFDVFPAIVEALKLARLELSVRQRAQRLLAVLRPESDRSGHDLHQAVKWIELVDELISSTLGDGPREAQLALWVERARALCRRTESLEGGDSLALAEDFVNARANGVPLAKVRAWLQRVLRRNVLNGPGAPIWVARHLRRRALPKLSDGRWVLSSVVENGVEFQQVSDGVEDAFRFVVARSIHRNSDLRMELRWNRAWLGRDPIAREGDELIFEVPIERTPPKKIRARFQGLSRHSNGGLGYGREVPIVFHSLDVQLELAKWAITQKKNRVIPRLLEPLLKNG